MAGRRLLDLASLFNASRGVAQKHVALRARQLDVYNRTSTIARAVRYQTERVTETAKAASVLSSRLNESAPAWTYDVKEDTASATKQEEETSIPRKESVEGVPVHEVKEGIEQDHHYDRSPTNAPSDAPPEQDLNIHQEKPDRHPLPDGTIPPKDFLEKDERIDADSLSVRPKDEPLKEPLEHDGLKPKSSDSSTIPEPSHNRLSSIGARVAQRNAEFQIPSRTADAFENSVDLKLEGHDEDSFSKPSTHISTTLPSLPRTKIPKHSSDTQGPEHPEKSAWNPDTFYGTTASGPTAVEDEVPEGVNLDLFYSPRTARKLGGRVQQGGIGVSSGNSVKASQFASYGHAKSHVNESDPFSKQREANSETSVDEFKELAKDIVQETAADNKVGHGIIPIRSRTDH
jgi:aarF domain-containing kinase